GYGEEQVIGAPVALASDTWFLGAGRLELTAPLSGAHALTVSGDGPGASGTLVLNATTGLAGPVNVIGGALVMNGVLSAAAPVTVKGGELDVQTLDDHVASLSFLSGVLHVANDLHVGPGHSLTSLMVPQGSGVVVDGTFTVDAGVTTLAGGSLTVGTLASSGG